MHTTYADGNAKSARAFEAEAEGRYPLTEAIRRLGWRVKPATVRGLLPCDEWHHTGKFAAKTRYYDVVGLRRWLAGALADDEADEAAHDAAVLRLLSAVQGERENGLRKAPPERGEALVVWRSFYRVNRRYAAYTECFWGSAELTADGRWLRLSGGTRKDLHGKNIIACGFRPEGETEPQVLNGWRIPE